MNGWTSIAPVLTLSAALIVITVSRVMHMRSDRRRIVALEAQVEAALAVARRWESIANDALETARRLEGCVDSTQKAFADYVAASTTRMQP